VTIFVQHVVGGLGAGSIYGLLALGIVIVHRATGVLNFAQGELATLSAFICWALIEHGWSFWPAFTATLILSFGGGVAIEQVLIRPMQGSPLVAIVILTVGLLLAINGLTTWIWGSDARQLAGPFSAAPVHLGGVSFPKVELGVIGVSVVAFALVGLFFARTKTGLGLRAAAANPFEARLVGIHVGAMAAVGWGLAAALGAVAGVFAAPSLLLEPNMMLRVLLYSFAAALLGGIDSPLGAVVGGLLLGVVVNVAGHYIHWIDSELRLATALGVIFGVLLVRPSGLFGETSAERV
jgi:branched-chain amino acid transport system permease protein